MRMFGNSGIWELFVPRAAEFDKYKFRIKDRNGKTVDKSDPFGFYSEIRPMKASIVYDLGVYHWKDSEWLKKEKKATYIIHHSIYMK